MYDCIWTGLKGFKFLYLNKGGLFRPVCWYVFVDPFVQVGFAVSDDFAQFNERQAVSVRHTPDGKRVDLDADIDGGVARCHQAGRRDIADFFDRSSFSHIFSPERKGEKRQKKRISPFVPI